MSAEIPGFASARMRVDGLTLHVASSWDGPPVLLLQGFPQTHLAWRAVAPALAERFRVVCPDLPGYGEQDQQAGQRLAMPTLAMW